LETTLGLAQQVYSQAHRRVILGEAVACEDKVISIFETHSDIICRGKKGSPSEFGHKFDVATGRSGLITRYEVYQGNPCDGEVLERAIEDHKRLFNNTPERLAGDRRYHSAANERIAAQAGVREVALPKPGRLSEVRKSLQKAPWFRRLMRFRAGVEGNLSTLLRSFGLKRCLWKGWKSFKAYIGLGVLTYNLRLLAGHLVLA
jgi:IS5 family transposase